MKKFTVHTIVLILIAFFSCNLLAYLSLRLLRSSDFYKPSYVANHDYKNPLDYIILGSSVGLTGLDSYVIDEISGLDGINIAMDDTGMSSHYLMLQHFLDQNRPPRYCILSPTVTNFDKDYQKIGNNDYRFLMYADEPYVHDYFKKFDGFKAGILKNSKYFPMLGTSYYNAEIFFPAMLSFIEPKRRNRFDERGNYTYPVTNDKMDSIRNKSDLYLKLSNPWLHKIESLCNDNNINLIYVVAPMRKFRVSAENRTNTLMNYSNVFHDSGLFYDDIHINSEGRRILSKQIGELLLAMDQNLGD